MEIGQHCPFESATHQDDITGRSVKRITSADYRSHHQYFYCHMWTPDSQKVVICSNRDDGIWRNYLVDIESGDGVCLTDAETARGLAEISPDGKTMLYSGGGSLRRLNLTDFSDEAIYTQESPWNGRGVYYSPTRDQTRAVMMEMHTDDGIEAKQGWDAFEPQFQKHPRCRLVEVDLATGQANVIHEDRCWLGHPNYRPNGKTIMFCHEGPWYLIDSRIWFIDPDGSNLREGKQRDPNCPPGEGTAELWGHEYWLADSSAAAYVYFPKDYGIDATIRLLDPDTLEETVLMDVTAYSHFISNSDGSMIVADGQTPLQDAVFLVDVASKQEQVLCRHGSSMEPWIDELTGKPNTQIAHPHPCFSPDSKRVVFSSDRDGSPAVYVVEI